jgi:hypothetical protein
MATGDRKPGVKAARRLLQFKVTHYPFFNGLAFLALYVVTYGGNEFLKPDE